jgi:hypothetical protein
MRLVMALATFILSWFLEVGAPISGATGPGFVFWGMRAGNVLVKSLLI